ncbi:TPA: scaffold protein involved in DNA repair [Clostridioides difficile]|nr:hypothetical protein [Clostridioides difficile]
MNKIEEAEEEYEDKVNNLPKVGSGFDCNLGGVVVDMPICRACKNERLENGKFSCVVFNTIPQKYNDYESYYCSEFIPDKESVFYRILLDLMERKK